MLRPTMTAATAPASTRSGLTHPLGMVALVLALHLLALGYLQRTVLAHSTTAPMPRPMAMQVAWHPAQTTQTQSASAATPVPLAAKPTPTPPQHTVPNPVKTVTQTAPPAPAPTNTAPTTKANASDGVNLAANTSPNAPASGGNNSNPSAANTGAAPAPSVSSKIELPSSNADYLNNPKPAYPALSRRLGEQGKVVVRVLIDANGAPQQAEIQQASGFQRLDQAALDTVLRWRYVPGQRGGVAQAMWFNVPINFVLE